MALTVLESFTIAETWTMFPEVEVVDGVQIPTVRFWRRLVQPLVPVMLILATKTVPMSPFVVFSYALEVVGNPEAALPVI